MSVTSFGDGCRTTACNGSVISLPKTIELGVLDVEGSVRHHYLL